MYETVYFVGFFSRYVARLELSGVFLSFLAMFLADIFSPYRIGP